MNDSPCAIDASILDTLARAEFMNGKKIQAIETEQKVLDVAPDQDKWRAHKALISYEQDKLPEANE